MSDEITEAAIREAVWGVPMAVSLPHLRWDGDAWVPREGASEIATPAPERPVPEPGFDPETGLWTGAPEHERWRP